VPASPKTTLIVGAVGFVSLALQIGGILFGELLSGRALIERTVRREVEETVVALRPGFGPEKGAAFVVPEHANVVEAAETPTDAPRGEVAAAELAAAVSVAASPALKRRWPMGDTTDKLFEEEAERFIAPMEPDPDEPELFASEPVQAAPGQLDGQELANLSADMALGRVRVMMLAGVDSQDDCLAVARSLAADAKHMELSLVVVDAGSGHPSTEPGITDLAAERVSFGDVVHKGPHDGLAEVPWGLLEDLDRRSRKPVTLIEALSDIYEVVVIMTGRIGIASTLPLFKGVPCRLVLVVTEQPDPAILEAARADTAALGYGVAQVVIVPPKHAAVA
jgi:hypothetical protein